MDMEEESGERTEDIEMKERAERERSDQEDEENTYEDNKRRDISFLDIDRSDPIFVRPDGERVEDLDIDSRLGGMGESDDRVRESIIQNKKQFLENGLGIVIDREDGDDSRAIYKELRITVSDKTDKINGATYKGKKILIMRGRKMMYSTAETNKEAVEEFKELLKRANEKHTSLSTYMAEKSAGVSLTRSSMDSITKNVNRKIDSKIGDIMIDISTNGEVSGNELREMRGLLRPKVRTLSDKLDAVKIERDNWRKKAREESETSKGKLHENAAKIADLKADSLRLKMNQKPVSEDVISMLKEESKTNDMTRFEKFKKWARENLTNLASISISVAGIVTTVVMATRNALNKGGDALGKLAKSVGDAVKKLAKKLGENLGPIISALGTLITNIIAMLAKGALFLAENLFILVLAITYFIYNEYKSRRNRPVER